MNGLENSKTEKNVTFVQIINGKFSVRVPEGTEGAIKRKLTKGNNEGKEVHELYFDKITGFLKKIDERENEFGNDFRFIIDTSSNGIDSAVILCLPISSSHATSLLTRIPYLDKNTKYVFKAYDFVNKEAKRKTGISIIEAETDKILKTAFTLEEPNGMPELIKKKVKGKDVWDDSDRIDFFRVLINNFSPSDITEATSSDTPEGISDKLPF